MYAVVLRATIHDAQKAGQILPLMKVLPGFVSAEWITLEEGDGLAIVTFESADAAHRMLDQWNTNPPAGDVLTVTNADFGEIQQRI
jgi:hypothetical protein